MSTSCSQALMSFLGKWAGLGDKSLALEPLSGDAGFRQYHRVIVRPENGVADYIGRLLVDSPPEKENNLAYAQSSLLLRLLETRVPNIHAVDFSQGLFLLEDLGTVHLADQVLAMPEVAPLWYKKALEQLLKIQSCQQCPSFIPPYDEALLRQEMELCEEWFLGRLLDLHITPEIAAQLQSLQTMLVASALEQPQVLVHRDFHCRNLMVLDGEELAVIDFQDAVWGPITYDPVSLSKDCYLRWSRTFRDEFLNYYTSELYKLGVLDEEGVKNMPSWLRNMGLQRHLKVLGIFARLHLRDAKSGYLSALPLVLRYCIEALEEGNEFSDIARWMRETLIPHCASQDWYSDWQTAGDDVLPSHTVFS